MDLCVYMLVSSEVLAQHIEIQVPPYVFYFAGVCVQADMFQG